MSIADQKRTNAHGNVSPISEGTRMQKLSQTYQWYRILRKVTEKMGSVSSKETLTKWSGDLRAIAKEMQLEARKAPL